MSCSCCTHRAPAPFDVYEEALKAVEEEVGPLFERVPRNHCREEKAVFYALSAFLSRPAFARFNTGWVHERIMSPFLNRDPGIRPPKGLRACMCEGQCVVRTDSEANLSAPAIRARRGLGMTYAVTCLKCGATEFGSTRDQADRAWNTYRCAGRVDWCSQVASVPFRYLPRGR